MSIERKNMLKKLVISIITIFLMWGCSNETIDIEALSKSIYESCNKEMVLLDKDKASAILFIDDISECYVYLPNDNSADIVAVIKGNNSEIEKGIKQYIESLKQTSAMYDPKEITKIDNYLLVNKDDVTIFVINDNIDNIEKIIKGQ